MHEETNEVHAVVARDNDEYDPVLLVQYVLDVFGYDSPATETEPACMWAMFRAASESRAGQDRESCDVVSLLLESRREGR